MVAQAQIDPSKNKIRIIVDPFVLNYLFNQMINQNPELLVRWDNYNDGSNKINMEDIDLISTDANNKFQSFMPKDGE